MRKLCLTLFASGTFILWNGVVFAGDTTRASTTPFITTPSGAVMQLAARPGEDEPDPDDLIVERAKKAAERKRATSSGGGAKETEDDLYVGNKPRTDNAAAPAFEPAPTKRILELQTKPVRTKPLPDNAVGTLNPESGKWHSFVTVKGPAFAKAERVAVIWYPSDDATQAQTGSITATLRKRIGTDEIEIEMPRDVGGPSGGVVRVYLFMPNQLQPVLAGRYTVTDTGLAVAQSPNTGTTTAPPAVLKRPAAAEREVSTRNIAPGPTLIAVTLEDAITARVSWWPLAGASSYKAHAAAIGINHSVTSQEVKQPVLDGSNQPGLPGAITYGLSGLAPGVEHNVWVTVTYPDGRVGTSDLRTVTTSGAENPTGFMAFPFVLPGIPGAVRLEWLVRTGAIHYFVEGSNLPRTQTTKTTFVVPDIRTVGTHAWTVIAVYPGGVYGARNAPRASVTCVHSATEQRVVCTRNRNP